MPEQVFAEDLAAFQLGGRAAAGRTPAGPDFLEGIDDAGGQGALRADDAEPHVVLFGEADQAGDSRPVAMVDVFAVQIGAGVARGHKNALGARALRDFPRQRHVPARRFPPPARSFVTTLAALRSLPTNRIIVIQVAGFQ